MNNSGLYDINTNNSTATNATFISSLTVNGSTSATWTETSATEIIYIKYR